LSPVLLFGFAATAATIIATLVIGLTTLRSVYDASAMTAHTYSVISALRQLLATAIDAETGQRGFLITGATTYLEPFDRARANLAAQIGQLRMLTGDNAEQQADIDRLSAVAAVKFAELEETIQLRRADDLAGARALVLSHEGKRTMDEMREIVERMEARENVPPHRPHCRGRPQLPPGSHREVHECRRGTARAWRALRRRVAIWREP
jgi:CHASE3 domain sensor protein